MAAAPATPNGDAPTSLRPPPVSPPACSTDGGCTSSAAASALSFRPPPSPVVSSPTGQRERALQGILLTFMRDLLSTSSQPLLRSSGDPTDAVRAAEISAACDLADDLIRCTQDLKGNGLGGGGAAGTSPQKQPSSASATAMAREQLSTRELVHRRVLMCRADALIRVTERAPQSATAAMLHAAYSSRTVREFLLAAGAIPLSAANGLSASTAASSAAAAAGGGGGGGQSTFADASWMASGLDAAQSISEHGMALDGVERLLERNLSQACPALLHESGLLSPRTANFQQRFEVGVHETLLGTFGCALHFAHGLRHGVLHVSTRHLCFEASNHAAAYTKLPLGSITSVEPCRDPLFHLIPNAIKVSALGGGEFAPDRGTFGVAGGSGGSTAVFASFAHRDEALALITRATAAEGGGAPGANGIEMTLT